MATKPLQAPSPTVDVFTYSLRTLPFCQVPEREGAALAYCQQRPPVLYWPIGRGGSEMDFLLDLLAGLILLMVLYLWQEGKRRLNRYRRRRK